MKRKLCILIMCILLAVTAASPVLAAGTASMQIKASSGTVYRGDTVTFTVSMSSVSNCKAAGIVVSYDSTVFEWVNGKCLASGAAISDFSGGTGSIAFSSGTTCGGSIFSFTLRVKSSAPFQSTTVSGSPSVRDTNGELSCSISGASVTVACKHNYQNGTQIDGSTHKLTCSICGGTKTENHTLTSNVNKAATCKEAGSETLTCSGCGYSKTQSLPKTTTHSYGSWSKVSDSTHKHTCKVCGKEETASHTWNSGKVTKEATCIATGTRVRTCTACGATKTETIPKASAHAYGAWERVDESTHTHICADCGKEETVSHSFDTWDHDEMYHYAVCSGCGERKDPEAHVPGPEATLTEDQVCTICQRVLAPATAHEHTYTDAWTVDEDYHWHKCAQCEEKEGLSTHTYTDDCDADCNVCGYERSAPHQLEEGYAADSENHWQQCPLCGQAVNITAHTPGPEATLRQAQTCTVCSWELSPRLTHEAHTFHSDGALHTHECECGEIYAADAENCEICKAARQDFPWWWIVIGIETAAIAAAAVWYFFIRKKA